MRNRKLIRDYLNTLWSDTIPKIESGHYREGGEDILKLTERIRSSIGRNEYDYLPFFLNSMENLGRYCSGEEKPIKRTVEGHIKTISSQRGLVEMELMY